MRVASSGLSLAQQMARETKSFHARLQETLRVYLVAYGLKLRLEVVFTKDLLAQALWLRYPQRQLMSAARLYGKQLVALELALTVQTT